MPYNPDIHHRKSIRLKGYDYSQAGLYFITLCTQNRAFLFGQIIDGVMICNDAGKMIAKWYHELENKFPDIRCHEMITMPNHYHCIIENVGADLRVCPNNGQSHRIAPTMGKQRENTLGKHGDISGKHGDISGEHGDISGECGNISGEHGDISGECGNISGECGNISGKHGNISGEHRNISGEHRNISGEHGDISGECGDISGEHGDISGEHRNISGKHGNISGECGDISGEHGDISGKHGNISSECGNISGEHGNISGEHGNISGEHGDISGEHIGSPLHRVVQWFKTMTTNEYIRGVKKMGWQSFDGKLWQRNYWEHIIRNPNEYYSVSKYIINNPRNWDNDKLKT